MPAPDINISQSQTGSYLLTHKDGTTNRNAAYGTDVIYKEARTTSSTRTPNFRTLQRNHKVLPINPYSIVTTKTIDPMQHASQLREFPGQVDTYDYFRNTLGTWCNAGGVLLNLEQDADDPTQKAIGFLLDDIRNSKTNAGVALAEAHKTALQVAKTATRIAKAIKALRQLHFGDFTNALGLTTSERQLRRFHKRKNLPVYQSNLRDFAADTWLEYSYGWKPLLKDIYDHANALAHVVVEHSGVVRHATSKAKTERITRMSKPDAYQIYHGVCEAYRSVKVGLWYAIPDGAVSTATAFGLNNPLEIAWELVPFSFVADWFLPVGDALRALTATDGLVFYGGYKDTRSKRDVRWTWEGSGQRVQSGSEFNTYRGRYDAVKEYRSFTRVKLTTWPSYGFPQWKDPRSFAHAASAIALLSSLFLKQKGFATETRGQFAGQKTLGTKTFTAWDQHPN